MEIFNDKDNGEYKSLNLDDLKNMIEDLTLAKENQPRIITLYTGDEGAANYLRNYFTEEEVQEWLKAPYDIPNLGLRVCEYTKPEKTNEQQSDNMGDYPGREIL